MSASLNSEAGLDFRQKLLSAPSIPGTTATAEAQATVDVRVLHQQVQSTIEATSNSAVINKDGRSAAMPADNPPPNPDVAILPTPLTPQSPTDIPDFSMAASDQFILNVNSSTIYFQDNASNVLASSSLTTFFSNVGASHPSGPQALYDPLAQRWFLAALDNFGTAQSSVLLGVSQASDPTMSWNLFKFAADSQGQTSAGALSSLGVNSNFMVLSTAQVQNAPPNPFQQSNVFAIDKNSLITNNTFSGTRFTDTGFLPCPAMVFDTQFPFVDLFTDLGTLSGQGTIRHGFIGTSQGQVRYIPSAEMISSPATWDIFPPRINFLPQQGSSTGIDGGDGRIANVVFRNNMLYWTHSAYQPAGSPDHSAIHWFTEDAVSGAKTDGFFQGGGSTSYYNPYIAVTPTGDLLITFSWASPNSFPSSGFRFQYQGQQDFLPYKTILPGTGPSVSLRNGINVGPTTSAITPTSSTVTAFLDSFIANKILVRGFNVSATYSALVASPNLPFSLQGIISADHGSAGGALGPQPGTPPGQVIFGNQFPSSVVGGLTINAMQFQVPNFSGSIQPGQQMYLFYGVVPSTLNSANLTMQPFTMGQQNQFLNFTFPQPIPVPLGQGFFAGVSGPGGQYCIGADTSLPLFGLAQSSPNGTTNFSADPFNFMVRLTAKPPCTSKLDKTERDFDGNGKKVCLAHGTTSQPRCPPLCSTDDDWIVIDGVFTPPSSDVEFNLLYHVLPNTSTWPRVGTIKVGGEDFIIREAGNNPLPAVNTTPNSASKGSNGTTIKVNQSGRTNASGLTPSATGFTNTTTVAWNGSARPTTFVSATEIDAVISADDLATDGTAQVTVFDLAPGGGTSPPVTFTISSGPDFSLSLDQPTVTAQAGTKAAVAITINRSGGFTDSVTVTPPAPQAGIKPKPADPISTTDTSARFKLKTGGSTPPGTYHLLFKGVDSTGRERDVTLTLVVSS
jgi:hypothetical protein